MRSCTLRVQRTWKGWESLGWTLIKERGVFLRLTLVTVLSRVVIILRRLVHGSRGRALPLSGSLFGCPLPACLAIPPLWAASQARSVPGCLFFTSPYTLIRSFQAGRASRGARGHRADLKGQLCSHHHHREQDGARGLGGQMAPGWGEHCSVGQTLLKAYPAGTLLFKSPGCLIGCSAFCLGCQELRPLSRRKAV